MKALTFKRGVHPPDSKHYTNQKPIQILMPTVDSDIVIKNMVRLGQVLAAIGIVVMLLPLSNTATLVGLILLGLGCAPIYPSLLHATPDNFGADKSQSIMGMQMACAYVGSTLMPPIFGFLADIISIQLYPFYMMIFVVLMVVMVERMNKVHN